MQNRLISIIFIYMQTKAPHGQLKKDMAKELRVLAKKSIGHHDSALAIQIAHSVNRIELLDSQLEKSKLK